MGVMTKTNETTGGSKYKWQDHVTKYGKNQVIGVTQRCADPWHFTFADHRAYEDGSPETGDVCPACAAVMLSGVAVTEAFYTEHEERKAGGMCLAATGGKFVCSCKASKKVLASGAHLCEKHSRGTV